MHRRIQSKCSILPNRSRFSPEESPPPQPYLINQRAKELLSQFFISSGLSYDNIDNSALNEFVHLLNPNILLPNVSQIEECVESLASTSKRQLLQSGFSKNLPPITTTIDFFRQNGEMFLAFSIHYFSDNGRENQVHLKKLLNSEFDGDFIMNYIRSVIDDVNSTKFMNIITSSEMLARKLNIDKEATNRYICFYTHLSRFVDALLTIGDFSCGLIKLRSFLIFIRKDNDLYAQASRLELARSKYFDFPLLDTVGKWPSTYILLTKCLVLHETFAELAADHRLKYISDELHVKLSYLQRLLTLVQRFAKRLAQSDSTLSQVVPTVVAICEFLDRKSLGFNFDKSCVSIFDKQLGPFMNGSRHSINLACLLDPRYAYNESIYTIESWTNFEQDLAFVCFGKKNAGRVKIIAEIVEYRAIISNARPLITTDPFVWWSSRKNELPHLYNKARDFLVPPAVGIDAEHFFGATGRFLHLSTTLNQQQFEDAMQAGANRITFRGRGFQPNIKSLPMLATSLPSSSSSSPTTSQEPLEKRPKLEVPYKILNNKESDEKEHPISCSVNPLIKKLERCAICQQFYESKILQMTTDKYDTLFVIIGMIIVDKMSINEACYRYKKVAANTWICSRHFSEARHYILQTIKCTTSEQIFLANQDGLKKCLDILSNLRVSIIPLQFKQLLMVFVDKYDSEKSGFIDENELREGIRYEDIFMDDELINDDYLGMTLMASPADPILPKELRPPRKQKLSTDEIEQETKKDQESISEESKAQQFICCYCGKSGERDDLISVPIDEGRQSLWIEQLGEEFENNLTSTQNPMICRTHFSKNSFNRRGQLYFGTLPMKDIPDSIEILNREIKKEVE